MLRGAVTGHSLFEAGLRFFLRVRPAAAARPRATVAVSGSRAPPPEKFDPPEELLGEPLGIDGAGLKTGLACGRLDGIVGELGWGLAWGFA